MSSPEPVLLTPSQVFAPSCLCCASWLSSHTVAIVKFQGPLATINPVFHVHRPTVWISSHTCRLPRLKVTAFLRANGTLHDIDESPLRQASRMEKPRKGVFGIRDIDGSAFPSTSCICHSQLGAYIISQVLGQKRVRSLGEVETWHGKTPEAWSVLLPEGG